MERVTGWYKERTQKTLFVIGFLIAAMFNLDTIAIGSTLAQSANLRQATAALGEGLTPESVATREQAEMELARLATAGLPIGYACVGRSASAAGAEIPALTLRTRDHLFGSGARLRAGRLGYQAHWMFNHGLSGDIGRTVLVLRGEATG